MSVGNRLYKPKTTQETHQIEGEADTAAWIEKTRKLKATTHYDVPYGGGAAVDASELYIDRMLFAEVMGLRSASLTVKVPGMTGSQIIRLWLDHEGVEVACELGDNPADSYPACHSVATADEDAGAEMILGRGRSGYYEDRIKPALERCLQRSVRRIRAGTFRPPPLLWCGPILDDPVPPDPILIRGLRACGVEDAFKRSKSDSSVQYTMGGRICDDCKHYGKPLAGTDGELAPCELVCGMVRWNRQCNLYEARSARKSG